MNNSRWRKHCLIALAIGLTISGCTSEQKPPEKGWQQFFDDGKFLDIQEKYPESRANYESALTKLKGEKFEQDWRAEIIARLARLDVLEGKLDQADEHANEAIKLAIDPKAQGPNHGEVLVALDDLAECYAQYSSKTRATKVRCLKMAIKILDTTLTKKRHVLMNRSTCELAVELITTGKKDEAAPYEELVIKQATETKKWASMRDLAAAHGFIKDQAKVDEYAALSKKLYSKKNPEAIFKAAYMMELAKLYRDNDRLDDARKVIVDYMADVKPENIGADTYELLATIDGAQGDIKKAKENWRNAILKDAAHSKLKNNRSRLENYARYLREIKQMDEAKLIQQQADRMRDTVDTFKF